jgi:carbohydrate kinase (thermoresistant glucokinase family)
MGSERIKITMKEIIYIMGVSGSGKTTIGKLLQLKTGIPFFDADDFHSQANKEKMKAGHPLTDEDRIAWLEEISSLALQQTKLAGAIIACSALKEKYRSILNNGLTKPVWIFLEGDYETIAGRMKNRTQHFMPASLLQSQFESLEIPLQACRISIEKEPEEIVEMISAYLVSGAV